MQTGCQQISTPSLLSTVELSILAVIKVGFYGFQMGEIAPKPIRRNDRLCAPTRRYFLFSISSFLANVESDILQAMVRYKGGLGEIGEWRVRQCCVSQQPEGDVMLRNGTSA